MLKHFKAHKSIYGNILGWICMALMFAIAIVLGMLTQDMLGLSAYAPASMFAVITLISFLVSTGRLP